MLVPPYSIMEGMLSRPAAISMAGVVLSHPDMPTNASYACAFIVISTVFAIISLLTSEYFMPSYPIATPSITNGVANILGVPLL